MGKRAKPIGSSWIWCSELTLAWLRKQKGQDVAQTKPPIPSIASFLVAALQLHFGLCCRSKEPEPQLISLRPRHGKQAIEQRSGCGKADDAGGGGWGGRTWNRRPAPAARHSLSAQSSTSQFIFGLALMLGSCNCPSLCRPFAHVVHRLSQSASAR